MELKKVVLVVVDISGYTQYIKFNKTALLHAEEIISALLEAIIDQSKHPLTLNKLEGDAAFMFAVMGDSEAETIQDVLQQVQAFFVAFKAKNHELSNGRASCPCDACQRIRELTLKAIIHQGEVAIKKVRQFEELAGEEVILIHRLLKNSVPSHEYILATEAVYKFLGKEFEAQSELREEQCDGLGPVNVRVMYPSANQ
jgi:class 3 adenylate cyclase